MKTRINFETASLPTRLSAVEHQVPNMKVFSKFVFLCVLSVVAWLPSVLRAQGPASIADWFEKNPAWMLAESVELPAGGSQV